MMMTGMKEYAGLIVILLVFVLFVSVMARGIIISVKKKKYKTAYADFLLVILVLCASLWLYTHPPISSHTDVPFDYAQLPAWENDPVCVINDNIPYFTEEEKQAEEYERYGKLDSLGRCTAAQAMVGRDMMPQEERADISEIRPSGFIGAKYDDLIEDGFLYNRCHLIAFELTGENANAENLITGTRYLNTEGMLYYENLAASYIRRTGNHVLYRATPVFVSSDLVCRGVLLEAYSVEDDGGGISFCVFCYNVQPGIVIDYRTGASRRAS